MAVDNRLTSDDRVLGSRTLLIRGLGVRSRSFGVVQPKVRFTTSPTGPFRAARPGLRGEALTATVDELNTAAATVRGHLIL